MKVLLISSNSSHTGGGEQYLINLARGINELGGVVEILLSDRHYMNTWEAQARQYGIHVQRAPLISLRERPLRFFQSLMDSKNINLIAHICKDIRPDVIHVNQQYDADGLDYIIGALKSKVAPVFGTIHMPMSLIAHPRDPNKLRTRLLAIGAVDIIKRNLLKKFYARNKYAKIFVSNAMKYEFELVYGAQANSTVIYNGVIIN